MARKLRAAMSSMPERDIWDYVCKNQAKNDWCGIVDTEEWDDTP